MLGRSIQGLFLGSLPDDEELRLKGDKNHETIKSTQQA